MFSKNSIYFIEILILTSIEIKHLLCEDLKFKESEDKNDLKFFFQNKTESTSIPYKILTEIKLSKLQRPSNKTIQEIYAIQYQNDFYIECQINSQLSDNPLIYWWFNSTKTNNLKIIKRPTTEKITQKIQSSNFSKIKRNNQAPSKFTIVSRIYIDCPSSEDEGTYYCAAIDQNIYHKSVINLKVLVPSFKELIPKSKKSCELVPYKLFGPNPARIIEYTSVLFNYEFENVLLKCRTQKFRIQYKGLIFKNPKYGLKKNSKRDLSISSESNTIPLTHVWLDNRNKQIKESNDMYKLFDNGDLLIKNLNYEKHFGQFACITRKGNRIDSVSTFIFPLKNEENDVLLEREN